jgi:V-type H+-transporting ATPase subunit E
MLCGSAQSNQINKARLKVLQAREETLAELLNEAKKQLGSVASDGSYRGLLKDLILQVRLFDLSLIFIHG